MLFACFVAGKKKMLTISFSLVNFLIMCGKLSMLGPEQLVHCITVGLNFFAVCRQPKRHRGRHVIWMGAVWVLWMLRNNIIFREGSIDLVDAMTTIKILSWNWFVNRREENSGILYSN